MMQVLDGTCKLQIYTLKLSTSFLENTEASEKVAKINKKTIGQDLF